MKKSVFAFALVACLVFSAFPAYAINIDSNDTLSTTVTAVDNEKVVINMAVEWLNANYGEFYNIKDVHADIARTHKAESATNYTVAMTCMTQLKAASVEDLPFVQGIYAELSNQKSVSDTEKAATDKYVNQIDFTKEYTVLSIDIVISIGVSSKGASLTMYYQDGMDSSLYPIEDVKPNAEQMYQDGKAAVNSILTAYLNVASPAGYSSYDRIAAKGYALAWTDPTNVTSCYDDGTSCGFFQNRTLWNNSAYPYITNLKHDDCADYVSQCIYAGGIPIDSTKWDRFNDGPNGWSWTFVPGLKSYMTGKGYWDTSTFAAANAGNILYWADGTHVALITLNDTVTHRFTAHTNDRYNYQFSSSSSYVYYTIKTTP
jgi:RNA polymerase sigma-70 factor (ECF subfamily)